MDVACHDHTGIIPENASTIFQMTVTCYMIQLEWGKFIAPCGGWSKTEIVTPVVLWEFDLAIQDRVEGFSKWQGALKLFPWDQLPNIPLMAWDCVIKARPKPEQSRSLRPSEALKWRKRKRLSATGIGQTDTIGLIDCLNLMNLMGHWNGYHRAVAAPILSVRKPVEKMPRASRQTNDRMHVMKFCTSRDCECPKCRVLSMVEK